MEMHTYTSCKPEAELRIFKAARKLLNFDGRINRHALALSSPGTSAWHLQERCESGMWSIFMQPVRRIMGRTCILHVRTMQRCNKLAGLVTRRVEPFFCVSKVGSWMHDPSSNWELINKTQESQSRLWIFSRPTLVRHRFMISDHGQDSIDLTVTAVKRATYTLRWHPMYHRLCSRVPITMLYLHIPKNSWHTACPLH